MQLLQGSGAKGAIGAKAPPFASDSRLGTPSEMALRAANWRTSDGSKKIEKWGNHAQVENCEFPNLLAKPANAFVLAGILSPSIVIFWKPPNLV